MIIYKAINLINGKIYIGQTENFHIRKTTRKSGALGGIKTSYFDNAIRKYGWESFKFEEIDYCETQEETDYMETYWINWFHSRDKRYGYNLAKGGRTNRGYKKTPEQIENHAKTLRGRHLSIKTEFKKGKIAQNKGIPHSEEMKVKLRKAKEGWNPIWSNKRVKCLETNIIYNSIVEASIILNISRRHISSVCKGKRKTCGGFSWKYVENNKND